MNYSGTLRGSRPTAGQLRPRILRLIRADALAARGRIHPGLLGKEPSSTKYNPAPSLRALVFDVPRSVPSGSSLLGHWPDKRRCGKRLARSGGVVDPAPDAGPFQRPPPVVRRLFRLTWPRFLARRRVMAPHGQRGCLRQPRGRPGPAPCVLRCAAISRVARARPDPSSPKRREL